MINKEIKIKLEKNEIIIDKNGYKHYSLKSYRLAKTTINNLEIMKKKFGESYNLLFFELIKLYKKNKLSNNKTKRRS